MKVYKAYAKVNIFLKVTGMRGDYHEIISRFMKVQNLYDELSFLPKEDTKYRENEFVILGDFACKTEQNTIYKAYFALKEATQSQSLEKLMRTYVVEVKKNIPAFAGLGGGSSDAATYLKMCNEVLHLGLSQNELATIGLKVGADVPFFIYGYNAANVGGIGEVVEKFDEELLDFEVYTPKIEISTPKVYQAYRKDFYAPVDEEEIQRYKNITSLKALQTKTAEELNDLFKPALQEYKDLKSHYKNGYFFSGSGSSFFKVKEEK